MEKQLENHLLNFMLNDGNEGTFMFEKLWDIEFHEGGKVWLDGEIVMISGDNGLTTLDELTVENFTN